MGKLDQPKSVETNGVDDGEVVILDDDGNPQRDEADILMEAAVKATRGPDNPPFTIEQADAEREERMAKNLRDIADRAQN